MAEIKQLRSDFLRSFLFLEYKVDPTIIDLDKSTEENYYISQTGFYVFLASTPNTDTLNELKGDRYLIEEIRFSMLHNSNEGKLNPIIGPRLVTSHCGYVIINKKTYLKNEFYSAFLEHFRSNTFKDSISIADTQDFNNIKTDVNEKALNNIMVEIKNIMPSEETSLQSKIDRTLDLIASHYKEIDKLNDALITLYGKRAMLSENPINTELASLFRYNNNIQAVRTILNTIRVYTKFLPVYYTVGEENINNYIYNNNRMRCSNTAKDMLKDALSTREQYQILTIPSLIKIEYDSTNLKLNYNINSVYSSSLKMIDDRILKLLNETPNNLSAYNFKNYHWFEYSCLGSFAAKIEEATRKHDIPRLLNHIIQYLSTINLADGAGISWLRDHKHLIQNIKTNELYLVQPYEQGNEPYKLPIKVEDLYKDYRILHEINNNLYIKEEN